MCGRMTLSTADWVTVAEDLLATATAETMAALHPRYNVAPTQFHPVVHAHGDGANLLTMAQWGFPGKRAGPLVINARAESVAEKPMFRRALTNHRCVVVAEGFIEWRKAPTGRQPLWFRRKGGHSLYMAGLYTPAGATAAGSPPRFVVLTTAPNHLVAPVHDRMPALLSPEAARAWLKAPAEELLRPAPDAWLTSTEISSRINNTANDDPDCLSPASSQRTQLSLF